MIIIKICSYIEWKKKIQHQFWGLGSFLAMLGEPCGAREQTWDFVCKAYIPVPGPQTVNVIYLLPFGFWNYTWECLKTTSIVVLRGHSQQCSLECQSSNLGLLQIKYGPSPVSYLSSQLLVLKNSLSNTKSGRWFSILMNDSINVDLCLSLSFF